MDIIKFRRGFFSRTTPPEEISQFLRKFRPLKISEPLVRIGGNKDGGYLLPNNFENISLCFSAGCDKNWAFEKQLFDNYGIVSHIVDSEEKRPSDLYEEFSYTAAWLGPKTNKNEISILEWLNTYQIPDSTEYILQMDIEGFEWWYLNDLPKNILKKFKYIVVEFHNISIISNRKIFTQYCDPLITRILEDFDVVHFHPNNCCGMHYFKDLPFPRVFEVTFQKKSTQYSSSEFATLPNFMDTLNVDVNDDLVVNWNLFS